MRTCFVGHCPHLVPLLSYGIFNVSLFSMCLIIHNELSLSIPLSIDDLRMNDVQPYLITDNEQTFVIEKDVLNLNVFRLNCFWYYLSATCCFNLHFVFRLNWWYSYSFSSFGGIIC
jgi:hypothetical protein